MKPKKLWFLTLIFTCLMLFGCGSKPEISGTWQLSEMQLADQRYSIKEFAETIHAQAETDQVGMKLMISDDGTFELYRNNGDQKLASGTYEKNQNDEYVLTGEAKQLQVTATLENDNLVLTDTISEVKSKMYFVKE